MKPLIFLPDTSKAYPYTYPGGGGNNNGLPKRDRFKHAAKLQQELSDAVEKDKASAERGGTYLCFNSSKGYALDPEQFNNASKDVQLLNLQTTDGDDAVATATVYVPEEHSDFFESKVSDYGNPELKTPKNNPKNKSLVESIDSIAAASAHSLWFGNPADYPKEMPAWREIWIGVGREEAKELFERFEAWCSDNQVEASKDYLAFPERLVVLARLNAAGLDDLYDSTIAPLAEIRRLPEPNNDFLNFESSFQRELSEDLVNRIKPSDSGASICLLDSGINADHILLMPAIKDGRVLAAEEGWSAADTGAHAGHGTMMAGVALYDDLKAALLSSDPIYLHSALESVRIFPPSGSNERHLYGAVTSDAMAQIEIEQPAKNRLFCMAVTDTPDLQDGSPSSWSAKLDELTSDAAADGRDRRLCFVSAGNVVQNGFREVPYPDHNINSEIEDPAQSWNALTVGAYSGGAVSHDPGLKGYTAVAPEGGLNPFSRTSVTWDDSWPIKPEICCEGGNLLADGHGNYIESDDLARLTTSADFPKQYFELIGATSAATAEASWMAARIWEKYPKLWPETVRALLVHSARWTNAMKKQWLSPNGKKSDRRALLRACGWGIPNIDYALGCLDNRACLVIQGIMRPLEDNQTTGDMHVHELPWPREELLRLGNTEAELRVTLSYFIEPNPGNRGWKTKFRYQSCGLRFQVIDRNQSLDDFLASVSKSMRTESFTKKAAADDWYLGPNNRDSGSIHSDFKITSAANLADARYVAVYPTKGWWSARKALGKTSGNVHYALVVSIDTPEVESRLYEEVTTKIKVSTVTELPAI